MAAFRNRLPTLRSSNMNKRTVVRRAGWIALSSFILLVLLVGAGAAYAWYTSQQAPAPAVVELKPANKDDQKLRNTPIGENVPANASIQVLTSPVAPGSNVSVTAKANPGSTCSIVVTYDDVKSTDSGLRDKAVDSFGIVTWAWTVEETVPEGSWPVDITCFFRDKSAVVAGKLVVSSDPDVLSGKTTLEN